MFDENKDVFREEEDGGCIDDNKDVFRDEEDGGLT